MYAGIIIAFLDCEGDITTILACTLVSRAWLPIALSKLFLSITFTNEQKWALFKIFLSPSAPPHITRLLKTVQELRIRQLTSEAESWSCEVLIDCAERLTALTRVELDNVSWTSGWFSSLSSIPPNAYGSVQDLIIYDMKTDVGNPHRLISIFPAISYLKIWRSSFNDLMLSEAPPTMNTQELKSLSQLHSLAELELGDCNPDHVVRWIADSGLVKHLKRLILNGCSVCKEKQWITLSETIDRCSLSYLSCGFYMGDGPDPRMCL